MKNQLDNSWRLTAVVLVALLLMHHLPRVSLFGHRLRAVDLLSDVRPHREMLPSDTIAEDTIIPSFEVHRAAFVDTCRAGLVCIEDYGDSTRRGMSPFYQALRELSGGEERLVRIAYMGDSFIEGDILTANLREMLQERHGGCGVGYIPLSTVASGFRRTVYQSVEGWEAHSVMDTIHFDRDLQDISGHYYKPIEFPAGAHFRGQGKDFQFLDSCQQSSFLFKAGSAVRISASVNGHEILADREFTGAQLQEVRLSGRIRSVSYTVHQASPNALFYGVIMDGLRGIALDNLAMRGSSGMHLRSVPSSMMRDFYNIRPYDLVILQFGLNVATEQRTDYTKYTESMRGVIQHIKQHFPGAGILVVSVADRDYKTEEGAVITMPGIRSLIKHQQNLAAAEGVAFWNMFQAMGGSGSMKRLVEANPPMANHDYTHINHRGGKYLAGLLYDALTYGQEQYERRRAYHDE